MKINGKEYKNTKMCVWRFNRWGDKARYWDRVFEDADGKQYIKVRGRMAALSEYKIYAVSTLS